MCIHSLPWLVARDCAPRQTEWQLTSADRHLCIHSINYKHSTYKNVTCSIAQNTRVIYEYICILHILSM